VAEKKDIFNEGIIYLRDLLNEKQRDLYKEINKDRDSGKIDLEEWKERRANVRQDKAEIINLLEGYPEVDPKGRPYANMNLQRAVNEKMRDNFITITSPEKLGFLDNLLRQTALNTGALGLSYLGIDTGDNKINTMKDLLTDQNVIDLGKASGINQVKNLQEYYNKEGKLPSFVGLFRDQYTPSGTTYKLTEDEELDAIDNPNFIGKQKATYDPITPENQSEIFSDKEIKGLSEMLAARDKDKDNKMPEGEINTAQFMGNVTQGDYLSGKPLGSALHDSFGKAQYGHYDRMSGEWQAGIPDEEGNYSLKDTYNWNRDLGSGLSYMIEMIMDPSKARSQPNIEGIAHSTGPSDRRGEGREIEINVPTYNNDPMQQMNLLSSKLGPYDKVTREGIGSYVVDRMTPLGQGDLPGIYWQPEAFTSSEGNEVDDSDANYGGFGDFGDDFGGFGMKGGGHIFREVNKLKMNDRNAKNNLYEMIGIKPVVGKQYGGGLSDAYSTLADRRQNMYGMGQTPSQMSSVFQDPIETSAFSPVNMEQGGDIVVPKERIINDQPHQLSYINSEEAKLLKDLGGSGRRVDGIPAYYYGSGEDSADEMDPNFSDFGDDQGSYQDQLEQAMSRQSPSLASLVDQGIISKDEAYTSDQFGPSIALAAAQARAQDIEDSKQTYGGFLGINRLDPRIARKEIRNIQDDDVAKLQDLIDTDQLVGAGIPVANMLEKDYDLRTFNKGLRSGLEQYSQGSATNRDDPNLGGFVDDPEGVKDFLMELERAKPGETMAQFAERYSKETGREAPLGRIGFNPSSSRDMSKNAADVNAAIQENNLKGAIQGLGLFGGMFTGAGGLGNFTQGYTGEFKGKTPQSQTAFGAAASGLSKGLGLDTLVDKFGNIISTGREAIFGPKESEFKQREAIAREQLGREPTLEEVNNINLSSSSISPSDVLGFVDNPFSALVALGSGKPTTAADIARAREEVEKDKSIKPTDTFDSELATATGAIIPTEKNITSLNNNLIFDSGNDQPERKRIVKPDTPKEVTEVVEEKEEVTTDGKLSNRAKASAESIKSLIKLRNASSDAQIDAIISDLGIDKAGLTVSEFLKELGIER